MISDIIYSSKSDDWSTPQDLFNKLDAEFHFTLDPCANSENAKCVKFYTKEENGLSKDWSKERVFLNPPYGRDIYKWIKKALDENTKGALVVCLIPARTDTKTWHELIFPYAEIRFLRGRLKFGGVNNSAPFPSAVVIFRNK